MSIRGKFLCVLIFSLAVMAGAVSYAAHLYGAREAETLFAKTASSHMDRVEDVIRTYFSASEQAARNLAALPEVRNAVREDALQRSLATFRSFVPGVTAAFCGYKNGAYLASPLPSGDTDDPRTQPWYSDAAWGSADIAITDAYISEEGKGLAATVSARITDDAGDVLGVAALDVNLAPLTDTLRDIRVGRTGYLVLFDAKGRVLLDPTAQEHLMLSAAQTGDSALLSLMQAAPGPHEVVRDGKRYAVFSRVLNETRWKAAILIDETGLAASGNGVARAVMLAAGACCVLLAGLGALLTLAATRPLQALIRQSGALADGNVDALEVIPGRGPDITALHGNLGRLTGRVMLLLQTEKDKTNEIEHRSRQAAEARINTVTADADARISTARSEAEARISAAESDAAARIRAAESDAETRIRAAEADKTARLAALAAYRKATDTIPSLAAEIAAAMHALARDTAELADKTQAGQLATGSAKDMADTLLDDTKRHARQAGETEENADATAHLAQASQVLAQDMARALETAGQALTPLQPGLETLKSGIAEMAEMSAFVRRLAEQANLLGLSISIDTAGAGEDDGELALATGSLRGLAEKAMTVAGSIESAASSLEQALTGHALACNKSAATAKRAYAMAGKNADAFARITATAATAAEQVRVLSIALEGSVSLGAASSENAETALRLARETEETAGNLAGTAETLSALSARLAQVSETLEAVPGGEVPHAASPAHGKSAQKPLD